MEQFELSYEELASRLSRAEAIIEALQHGEIDATILGNKQIVLIRPEEMVRQTEAELRASERRYRSLVTATAQIVWRTDPTGRVVDEIPTWQEFAGCSKETLLGKGWLNTLHPDDVPHVQQIWQQAIEAQKPFELEFRILRHDAVYRDFRVRGVPIFNYPDDLEEWIGTCTDITESKQIRVMLDDERNLLLTLIDNLPDYIYVKDVKSRYLLVNEALRRQLGAGSKDEVIGKTEFEFTAPELAGQYFESEQDIFTTGQPLVSHREPILDHDSGSRRWVLTTKIPFHDTQGHLKGLVGMNRDITELQDMKEALQRERDFAEGLIETAQVIILVLDTQGRIVRFNRYMEQVSGYTLTNVGGEDWIETFIPDEHKAKTRAAFKEALNEIRTLGNISPIITKDGTQRQIEWYDKTLKDPHGEVVGLLAIGQDITVRLQAEHEKDHLLEAVKQQREQLRALTRQLAEAQEAERKTLARELHDQIGQSLTALDLNLNLISTQLAKPTSHVPDIVRTRLEDSLTLVAQTAERIRDVMATLRPSVLDDYGIVAALRWYGNKLASRTEFYVKIDGDEITPRLATPVEDTLFRIAQEALTNVAKHAQAERVIIQVSSQNGRVRMAISDDGQGFDPASQMKPSEQQHWGLVTMIERTEALGGRCQIKSSVGQGTQVVVEVPR
ncbi:MAG: PAS domain S-box protein [Anaerolineales bacterium]|nr:PAS domain S-box protein [Anaerolineales bacterium]